MQKLEIVIRPESVPKLKKILSECGATGAMFSNVSGYGNQKSKQYVYRGKEYFEQIFLKTKVETIVTKDVADKIVKLVLQELPTGEIGDGKIFVYDIAKIIRIRTAEEDEDAL